MKKRSIRILLQMLIFVAGIVVAGCQFNNKDKTFTGGCSKSEIANITDTDGGTYGFLKFMTNDDHFLYYWDFEEGEAIKLCAKPECTHTSSECNAYFESPYPYLIEYRDPYIYVCDYNQIDHTPILYRLDKDGSNRTKIMLIPERYGSPQFGVFTDKAWYAIASIGINEDGYFEDSVIRISLDGTGKEVENIYVPEYEAEIPQKRPELIGFSGGKFYFKLEEIGKKYCKNRIFCYTEETKELNEIYESDFNGYIFATIQDEKLYIEEIPVSVELSDNASIYSVDLTSMKKELFCSNRGVLSCDNHYLYVSAAEKVSVYNQKGKLIKTLKGSFPEGIYAYSTYTTSKYVVLIGGNSERTKFYYQVINKQDIDKKNPERHCLVIGE